jgi:signal transduction histidine kinase
VKVRTRLSLFCSIVFGIIFTAVAAVIYALYYDNTKSLIYSNLKEVADISALFHLEEDELNEAEFEKIRTQFLKIVPDADCQVYSADNRPVHGERSFSVPVSVLDRIRRSGKHSFSTGKYLCYGIRYEDNQGDFVIVAKERQTTLTDRTHALLSILALCFLTGMIAIVLLSRWVSHVACLPFGRTVRQVKNLSADNLQIPSPGTGDELQELTDTFNDLLARIAETAVIQQNFVRYVSHEFKTPLTALMGSLEVFSLKDRTPGEYRRLSEKLIGQVGQMEEMLNALLVISDLQKETPVAGKVRLDELLWEIIDKLKARYPQGDIRMRLNVQPGEENLLSVSADRTQLLMMLCNLVENAIKYSQGKPVEVMLFHENSHLCMSIADRGIGIMPEHLANISKPFYRADHTGRIEGAGIGLSIALRIMEKNNIGYRIKSTVNAGTNIVLEFF